MGANDVELLTGRQFVQLELAAFRVTGDEHRAVGADVDVHDPGGTARIRDHGDLLTGRDVEHLRHDGRRRASPLPRRDRDAVAADERHPLAPGDAARRCGRGHPGSARSWRPVRTSQTRTARSAPSVARRVPSALNRVAKTPPRCARRHEPGRRWRHSRASRCRRRLPLRRASRPGRTRSARTSPLCPVSVTSFSPVRASRMLAVPPARSAATKRDPSGARETTCPMPVLRPTPATADSTREVASASWRACWASVSTVPSRRRVVSAASIARRMLRSGSTSRFACAEAAS